MIHSLLFSPNYSLFISNFSVIFIIHFFEFLYRFSFPKFSTMQFYTLFIKSLHFSIHSTLSLASTILFFSINVVKIMLSFSINRPSMQLLERDQDQTSQQLNNLTYENITNKQTIGEANTFHNRNRT